MSEFVPKGWIERKVSSFTKEHKQGYYTNNAYNDRGTYLIRITDLNNPKINYKDMPRLPINEKEFNQFKVDIGDFLFARSGAIGRYGIVDKQYPSVFASYLIRFRFDETKVSTRYFGYAYESDICQSQIAAITQGSSNININADNIKSLSVPFPPLPEQQKIAAILTSVDEVIEKTQAQINKLKDLKTGMMQELLTRGVGVDGKPHTEFKDSPVGRIPKAWEVVPLSKVAKLERGKFSHRPRNDPSFYNGDIPFLQTGDIPKKSPYITKYSQTLNEKGLGVSKLFPIGTLVITIAATIGEIGILEFDSCFPDSLVGIKIDMEKADAMYILYVMRHLKDELDLLAPQTAQKNINLDILNPFVVPVPPLKEQKQISQALESIDARLNILDEKLSKIQNTKKALMQDLLTGKVRVKVDTE